MVNHKQRTLKETLLEGRTSFPGIEYVSIAQGTAKHPRNDSASVVEFSDGRLFIVWIETRASKLGGNDEAPASIASMRSADGGRTWTDYRIEVSPGEGDRSVYNPSLILLPDGDLLFFFLKYHRLVWNEPLVASGYIKRSSDRGRTRSHPQSTGLSASESMPSLTRIPGTGHLLLVWNNARYDHTYDHNGNRTPLTSAISTDEGRQWIAIKNIEDASDVEFSNIATAHLSKRRVLITYFTCRMQDPNPPGKFGRDRMSLKGAITTIDRLYA